MKYSLLYFAIFIPAIFLAQVNSKSNDCKIQLENFHLTTKVSDYFLKNFLIDEKTQYLDENKRIVSAAEAFKIRGETEKFAKNNLTEKDLKKEFYFEDDDKKNIGYLYSKIRYVESDRTVCFGKLGFPTFTILSNNQDQFIAFIAESRSIPEEDFNELLNKLKKKYNIKLTDTDRFEVYTLILEKNTIQFKKAKKSYRSQSSVAVPSYPEGKIEVYKPTVDITLLLISKSATQKHMNWLSKNDIN